MPKKTKRIYNYKLTINEAYWREELKTIRRKLTKKDKKLLKAVRNEKRNNISMAKIQANALTHGLHIPCLTELVGDCMFESIEHTGFCKDRDAFRKSVAMLFYLFGDCDVISSHKETLKEVFDSFNDIEYVYCYKTELLYKYTYYTMCSDMFKRGSWSRLPTELILTVISVFFKVRFHIYHDNGYIDKICDTKLNDSIALDDYESNIYLALIENHYVPLVRIPHGDIKSLQCPKYDIERDKFHIWAREKADLIGLYDEVTDDDDIETDG